MTPAAHQTARVVYWGRGLRVGPAEYGFLLSDETFPRVLFFNAGHLSPDSLPPQAGMVASVGVVTGADGKANLQVTLKPSEPPTPQQWISSTLALARVVEVQPDSARLVTLPGYSASLRWGSDDAVQLQVGDYVRCRLLESDDSTLKEPLAFDVVRVDFSNPMEQARLEEYVRQASSEADGEARTVSDSEIKRRKRNRKSKWADLPEVTKGFTYDLSTNQLRLSKRRTELVPERFRDVLAELLARSHKPGRDVPRPGAISYRRMAELFERGRLEAQGLAYDDLEAQMHQRRGEIERRSVKLAQECVRQLARWLRRRKIDPGQFLQAEPKAHQYRLGDGWNEKAALGGGEAHYTLGADAGEGGD